MLTIVVRGRAAVSPARSEGAPREARAFDRSRFKGTEHRSANPTKSLVRRNVVESDLSRVRNRTDRVNRAMFNGEKNRVVRPGYPGCDDFRGLVGKPWHQDRWIVRMIRDA